MLFPSHFIHISVPFSQCYQAINYALLGFRKKARKLFVQCKREALKASSWSNVEDFVDSSVQWLRNEKQLVICDGDASLNIINSSNQL